MSNESETHLHISNQVAIPLSEIDFEAVRAQGAGGQNVNKTATAIHLRFGIRASSLPDFYKTRLLHKSDQRITKDGIIVIKAQQYRTQEQNRADALNRLQQLIRSVTAVPKVRRATKPTKGSKERRLEQKKRRGQKKAGRRGEYYAN